MPRNLWQLPEPNFRSRQNKQHQQLIMFCNTLKFGSLKMLIGRTINQRFSHNLKFSQQLFSLQEI
jgi:hypothetical protein